MKSENIFIRQLKKHPLSFLYRLIKNVVFALFIFSVVLLMLYAVGNYQNFQFESQKLILSAISLTSTLLLVLSILILVEATVRLLSRDGKFKTLLVIFFMVFNIIFCVFCMSFSNIVYYLSEGF